jgi:hypothetical protein
MRVQAYRNQGGVGSIYMHGQRPVTKIDWLLRLRSPNEDLQRRNLLFQSRDHTLRSSLLCLQRAQQLNSQFELARKRREGLKELVDEGVG